jgi:hypothetical protein
MEENEFNYFVSSKIFNRKLEKENFGQVHKSMVPTKTTIDEFKNVISRPVAHSWCGGEFRGKVNNKNWIKSSIIGLDFDTGTTTIEEVFRKFKEFCIVPNLHYDTFSSSPIFHKFRIVIFLDQPLIDRKIYEKVMRNFEKIFPIDPLCKNVSRIFYGGTNVKIINKLPVSLEKILDFINIHIVSRDNKNTRSVIKYQTSAKICNSLYDNNRNAHFSATNSNYNLFFTSKKRGVRIDWEKARKTIKVLDQFFKGEWLYHEQLFGLATNMIFIDGGEKLMNSTMKKYNEKGVTRYTDNNFSILPYIKDMNYFPMPVYKFSHYKEDNEVHDIITEVKNIRGHIEVLQSCEKISLDIAEEKMISTFNKVLKNDEKDITYIFALATAIGKTRLLTDVEKSVIAFPTNNLKNEISGKIKTNFIISPDTITFSNPFLNKKIEHYYKIGLPKKSMKIIRGVSKLTSSKDSFIANDYISKLEKCSDTEKTILTTHKRVLNSESFGHDTVIFDEDPLGSLVEIKKTSLKDLSGIQYLYEPLKKVLDFVHPLDDGIFETPIFNIDLDDLFKFCEGKNIFETNVFDFLRSKFFIKKE